MCALPQSCFSAFALASSLLYHFCIWPFPYFCLATVADNLPPPNTSRAACSASNGPRVSAPSTSRPSCLPLPLPKLTPTFSIPPNPASRDRPNLSSLLSPSPPQVSPPLTSYLIS